MSWQWLESPARPARWAVMIRVALKALILFALVNVVYAALDPLDALGRVSVYNWLVPGTERLTYNYHMLNLKRGNDVIAATNNIPALIASHSIAKAKPPHEFSVVFLGDSGTRGGAVLNGILYTHTVTARLSELNIQLPNQKQIVAYNLAYPQPAIARDFLIIHELLQRGIKPDLIVWMITPNAALPERLAHALVQNSSVAKQYGFTQASPTFWETTFIAQRRALADIFRLQAFGFTWAAIRYDGGPETPRYTLAQKPIELDSLTTEKLSSDALTLEIIDTAHQMVDGIPLLIINEPIYRVDDPNEPLIFSQVYRRDVYEHYQRVMQQYADDHGWHYVDLWDAIPPEHFTNSPLHYDAEGARILAERLADIIPQMLAEDAR